jgi:hypothetical protein
MSTFATDAAAQFAALNSGQSFPSVWIIFKISLDYI